MYIHYQIYIVRIISFYLLWFFRLQYVLDYDIQSKFIAYVIRLD